MGTEDCWPTMDLLRSEPMQLAHLIIPMESSRRAISYLGELGLFQFKDVSPSLSYFIVSFTFGLYIVYSSLNFCYFEAQCGKESVPANICRSGYFIFCFLVEST